jgi:hypothetical protein
MTGLERLLGRPIARCAPGLRPEASVSATQQFVLVAEGSFWLEIGAIRRFANALGSAVIGNVQFRGSDAESIVTAFEEFLWRKAYAPYQILEA